MVAVPGRDESINSPERGPTPLPSPVAGPPGTGSCVHRLRVSRRLYLDTDTLRGLARTPPPLPHPAPPSCLAHPLLWVAPLAAPTHTPPLFPYNLSEPSIPLAPWTTTLHPPLPPAQPNPLPLPLHLLSSANPNAFATSPGPACLAFGVGALASTLRLTVQQTLTCVPERPSRRSRPGDTRLRRPQANRRRRQNGPSPCPCVSSSSSPTAPALRGSLSHRRPGAQPVTAEPLPRPSLPSRLPNAPSPLGRCPARVGSHCRTSPAAAVPPTCGPGHLASTGIAWPTTAIDRTVCRIAPRTRPSPPRRIARQTTTNKAALPPSLLEPPWLPPSPSPRSMKRAPPPASPRNRPPQALALVAFPTTLVSHHPAPSTPILHPRPAARPTYHLCRLARPMSDRPPARRPTRAAPTTTTAGPIPITSHSSTPPRATTTAGRPRVPPPPTGTRARLQASIPSLCSRSAARRPWPKLRRASAPRSPAGIVGSARYVFLSRESAHPVAD